MKKTENRSREGLRQLNEDWPGGSKYNVPRISKLLFRANKEHLMHRVSVYVEESLPYSIMFYL